MATSVPPSSSTLKASVFRRHGPKRELLASAQTHQEADQQAGYEIEADDKQQLEEELQQLLQVLTAPKTGHGWSAAIWRPDVGAAELVLSRQDTGGKVGFKWRRRTWLHVEEATFLVDRSDLLLFVEEEADDAGQEALAQQGGAATAQGGGGAKGGEGPPKEQTGRSQWRLLSLQEVFELMVMAGVSMERYILYSTLSRSGYTIMRYPSCWVLQDGLTPAQVWGHGAWRGCAGLHHPPPLGASPAGASDGEASTTQAAAGPWQGGWAVLCEHLRSLHQGTAPVTRATLEGEEEEEDVEVEDGGAAGGGQAAVAGPSLAAQKGAQQQQQEEAAQAAPPSKRQRTDASDAAGEGGALPPPTPLAPTDGSHATPDAQQLASPRQQHRWWPRIGQLPMMAAGALPTTAAATACEGAGGNPVHSSGGVADAWPAPHAHAVDLPVCELLAERCPRLRPLPSITGDALGTLPPPSQHAHLVYDVYKPGSHVSRNKRAFPVVACHLAVSSARPPTLAEQRAADQQALNAMVPVKWAAVEGGIITMYELGGADLIRLI